MAEGVLILQRGGQARGGARGGHGSAASMAPVFSLAPQWWEGDDRWVPPVMILFFSFSFFFYLQQLLGIYLRPKTTF